VINTLRWHVENQDHALVIEGEITLATINPVLSMIASLTQARLPENVDLSGLGLCDSSAVALVLDATTRCKTCTARAFGLCRHCACMPVGCAFS